VSEEREVSLKRAPPGILGKIKAANRRSTSEAESQKPRSKSPAPTIPQPGEPVKRNNSKPRKAWTKRAKPTIPTAAPKVLETPVKNDISSDEGMEDVWHKFANLKKEAL